MLIYCRFHFLRYCIQFLRPPYLVYSAIQEVHFDCVYIE